MFDCVINIDTLLWVESQKFCKQIYCKWIGIRKSSSPFQMRWVIIHYLKSLFILNQIVSRVFIVYRSKVIVRQFSDKLLDNLHLVKLCLSLKQWLSTDQLSKNTPDCPKIYCFFVILVTQHNFRSTIPTSHDIFCQHVIVLDIVGKRRGSISLIDTSCEPKVTYLQITINIDQQVTRFYISMHNLRRVKIQKTSEQLIHKIAIVLVTKRLFGVNESAKIGFHLFSNDVNIFVLCFVVWFLNVNQLYDVLMFKEL